MRLAMASMGKRDSNVAALCEEPGITRQTLYRHVAPDGTLRADGKKARDPSREVGNLPSTYPMVAPNYRKHLRAVSKAARKADRQWSLRNDSRQTTHDHRRDFLRT